MDYVMAVQATVYPVSEGGFLVDRPFGRHLRELRESLPPTFKKLVLVAPVGSRPANQKSMMLIAPDEGGIVFVPAHSEAGSLFHFWRTAPMFYRKMKNLFSGPSLLHADLATDIRRPMTAIVMSAALAQRRKTLFVTDIDFREHPNRARKVGGSLIGFLVAVIQKQFKSLQVKRAVCKSDLILLKSSSMVRDFGAGRDRVKSFFDVVHTESDVLSDDQRNGRLSFLGDKDRALKICYFGRLVEYKGVDRIIKAVLLARQRGANISLKIVGDGPELGKLQGLASSADSAVEFIGGVEYGSTLFDAIADCDVSIHAPLREDTPRSAFDSLARGIPILAFNISYFRDLAQVSKAVKLAQWPDVEALAEQIISLAEDREALVQMAADGLDFSLANTQAVWITKRAQWMNRFVLENTG